MDLGSSYAHSQLHDGFLEPQVLCFYEFFSLLKRKHLDIFYGYIDIKMNVLMLYMKTFSLP
jgi:hypothetical protein